MLALFLIVLLGLTPSVLSFWILRQANERAQERFRLAINSVAIGQLQGLGLSPDHHYVEGMGYIIGDFTCQFNARSSYIRCAINPIGPCEGCSQYQPRPLAGE